jgi:hypothetical protein
VNKIFQGKNNMKYLIFFVFLTMLISQIACEQTTESISSDIYVNIEIESAFQDDSVKLTLDNNILLEGRVTTDYTISLAWSSGLKKISRSHHTLHFAVVEFGMHGDYSISTVNDTSTVLLRFDKSTKQITIKQIKGVILRD